MLPLIAPLVPAGKPAFTRSTISLAALFVNVRICIFSGRTPALIRYSALPTIVLVLPVPAPASSSKCLPSKVMASRCLVLYESIIAVFLFSKIGNYS